MATRGDAGDVRGRRVAGPDGEEIGTLEDVYVDRGSGRPRWLAVKTAGLLGKVRFVPASGPLPAEGDVAVGFAKERIADAPAVDVDGRLSPLDEKLLSEHYGET